LVVVVRNQGHLIRARLFNQFEKTRVITYFPGKGISLDIEFDAAVFATKFSKVIDIIRANMSLVGSGMNRNTMAAGLNAEASKFNRAWIITLPRIPQQGDLVEIYTKCGIAQRLQLAG
jgi:predicted flavoprotein YhiN